MLLLHTPMKQDDEWYEIDLYNKRFLEKYRN